jgi:hypothetical protein
LVVVHDNQEAMMKVMGSGSPAHLTLRLREREVSGLDRALELREAMAGGSSDATLELSPTQVRAEIAAVRERLAGAAKLEQARVEITGPTWLLAPVISSAAGAAAERLATTMLRFTRDGRGVDDAEELREAIGDASAWNETLIACRHAQHGPPSGARMSDG